VLGHGGQSLWGHAVDGLWQLQFLQAAYRGPGPWARSAHALAFDSWRGRLVLFGGGRRDSFGLGWLPVLDGGHTFEWDGSTWHTIPATAWTPATDPRFRVNAAMAFDRARGKTVLFGGAPVPMPQSTLTPRDDTFEWDGTVWTRMQPATVPPALAEPRLVFDPGLGKCVLWGNGSAWTWDGTDWTLLPFPAPPGVPDHDAANGRWVAFGTTQTWELAGGTWQPIPFAGTRGPMTFDVGVGAFAGNDELGAFTWGDPAAATLRPFGRGCAGTAGTPVLHGEDPPRLGRTTTLRLARAPANAPFVGLLGVDSQSWLGAMLPIDLAALGMPGCELHTAADAHVLLTGTTWPLVIPSTATLLGNRYRAQALVLDAGANAFGATTSTALAMRIGA